MEEGGEALVPDVVNVEEDGEALVPDAVNVEEDGDVLVPDVVELVAYGTKAGDIPDTGTAIGIGTTVAVV